MVSLGKVLSGLLWGVSQSIIGGVLTYTLFMTNYGDVKINLQAAAPYATIVVGTIGFALGFSLAWITYDGRFEHYKSQFTSGNQKGE